MIEGLRRGQRRALARAISLAESAPVAGERLLADWGPDPGRGLVLGFTGPPGVGKSTLISALINYALRDGHRVAVLAVDPSSPISGGALLADRHRFDAIDHPADRLFVRSLSTRGSSGGLTQGIRTSVRMLIDFGFDYVLLETAGVGQCDVDVVRIADFVCVLLSAEYGDELQAIKSGLMEIADAFVVTRCAQTDARQAADQIARSIHQAPRYRTGDAREPTVLATDAVNGHGMDALWEYLASIRHGEALRLSLQKKCRAFQGFSVVDQILDDLKTMLYMEMEAISAHDDSHQAEALIMKSILRFGLQNSQALDEVREELKLCANDEEIHHA